MGSKKINGKESREGGRGLGFPKEEKEPSNVSLPRGRQFGLRKNFSTT